MNIAKISNKGGRVYNQDYVDFAAANGLVCVAVADGLGAYEGSEQASEAAVKNVLRWFKQNAAKDEDMFSGAAVNRAFKGAHSAIHKLKSSSPELGSSCTTLSVIITDGEQLIAAHTGDTRIYFLKSGKVEFYSKDHSLARLAADRGEISYQEIRTHKDQNKLTRVLGSDYFIQPDFKHYEGICVDDAVLICTDGFWEYVYESDVENKLCTLPTSGQILGALEQILKQRAPEGSDNYSAVLLCFGDSKRGESESVAPPEPIIRQNATKSGSELVTPQADAALTDEDDEDFDFVDTYEEDEDDD